MTRDSLIALGKEFRRLGMSDHAEALAAYYRSNQGNVAPYGWSDAHVQAWLNRLRIPPYGLPLQPRNSACTGCGPEGVQGGPRTHVTFPGGCEVACDRCGARWVELANTEAKPLGATGSVQSSGHSRGDRLSSPK